MSGIILTEEEKEKACVLAEELRQKIEETFLKPYDPKAMAEVKAIRRKLEEMGFHVTWEGTLNTETLKLEANVTILLPKYIQ